MSIGEFFGIKQCRVRAESCRSIEELFMKIRNVPFDAGKPEIVRNENVIAFPALDESNQVQIYGQNGQFTVMRSTMPTSDNLLGDEQIEKLAENIPGTSWMFGSKKKLCMILCQRTADQINDMHL